MEKLVTAMGIVVAILAGNSAAIAGDGDWDDIWAPYTQRIDRGTPTSGNAQNVNTITHMISPWPPYVHDRRIPGNGARMVGAMERYRNPATDAGGAPPLQSLVPPSSGSNDSNDGSGDNQTGQSGQSGQFGQ